MIDTAHEQLISLAEASQLLPISRRGRRGRDPDGRLVGPLRHPGRVSFGTLLRWIVTGIKLADRTTLRLEAVRLSGRWITSKEALARFIQRQTPCFDDTLEASPSAGQRSRSTERAKSELQKAGI